MDIKRRAAAIAAAFIFAATLTACASPDRATSVAVSAFPVPDNPQARSRAPAIKDLAGLKPADVVAMLGQPDLRRDEPPAELWQYRAADCVLNLFFYAGAGGYRLAHAEAWRRTLASGSAPAQCHDEDAPIRAHLISESGR